MSADDHLSGPQFFHGTKHTLSPGDKLTPEGATIAKYGPERAARAMERGWGEKHVHYTDHSGLGEMGIYAGDGGHVYAVQPESRAGRAITRYSPDPHYKNYGGGAYRTTGQLRVLHEVDREGNKL